MAKLPQIIDPTLAALDAALAGSYADRWRPRQYLGASAIGHDCERRGWLSFRIASVDVPDAVGIKAIEDGHRGEAVMIEWLRAVPGVTLRVRGVDGSQLGFVALGGHFRGHYDGLILGLLQAPAAEHVWEAKVVNEQKQAKLVKLKIDLGEKQALAKWDAVYYAQAQVYMHYSGTTRHYLMAGSPGVRSIVSARTEYDPLAAARLVAKAERIVFAPRPPSKISEDPAWFECKLCPHHGVCHERKMPLKNCRTCMHSTPLADGGWRCEKHQIGLAFDQQLKGCWAHLYHPDLIPGEQVDAAHDWVDYRMPDGTVWRNQVESV